MYKNKMVKMLLSLIITLLVFSTSARAADTILKGFIIQDRFVVPMRAIFEALGAEVNWDEDKRTVTGTKGDISVELTIGSRVVTINGKTVELDVPATIINDRTYVPARFVSESFEASVSWNPDNKVAVINHQGKIIAVSQSFDRTDHEIIVDNTADSGTGTLRWAIQEAKSGDTIKFDPSIFPIDNPAEIFIINELPHIAQGFLTIDGSSAGVIIDGTKMQNTGQSISGLGIYSDGNVIQGLQIINFQAGAGIYLGNGSEYNKIGGSRNTGSGPMGQGNMLSGNSIGILIETMDDKDTSYNTIKGNLIGTDTTEKKDWGNKNSGIHINFASHNVIGPNNTIAFNHGEGVLISESPSVDNTISQNSIYDNKADGIRYNSIPLSKEAGNTTLIVPVILDFTLTTGVVKGYAFSNSVVEIFSETNNEGKIYEGKTKADANGYFVFHKGTSLKGPYLTATSTDIEGHTSPFSAPTFGAEKNHVFQTGNNASKNLIVSQTLNKLNNNRIGSTLLLLRRKYPTSEEIEGMSGVAKMWLDRVSDLNMKWQRVCLNPIEWGNTSDEAFSMYDPYSRNEITHYQYDGLKLLSENGVSITVPIVHWDEKLHANNPPDYSKEEDVNSYLEYSRFLVRNLKDKIDYWEILNEAVHYVELQDYLRLIQRTVYVIRQEDPDAKIVVGGSTILMYPEYKDYLFGVLQSDVMPLVDGIVIHSMYGPSPQYFDTRQYYYEYPELIRQMKVTAEANGFKGEYFADEMSWRTEHNRHFAEIWEYSETQAAKYYGRGIVMNQGMDLWTGIGEEDIQPIHQVVRNLGIIMSGATPIDIKTEIALEFDGPVSYCAFKYANGDKMLAVWSDAASQDYDPAYSTTITFAGLNAPKAIAMDTLYGIEQELVFEVEGQDTIIKNFLVKDYPVFIRLCNPKLGSNYTETKGDGFHRLGDI
jgi:hypothetical protein